MNKLKQSIIEDIDCCYKFTHIDSTDTKKSYDDGFNDALDVSKRIVSESFKNEFCNESYWEDSSNRLPDLNKLVFVVTESGEFAVATLSHIPDNVTAVGFVLSYDMKTPIENVVKWVYVDILYSIYVDGI